MWLALTGVCAAVLSLAGVYLYLDPQTPRAATYRELRLETPLRVYTLDKKLIAEFGERRLIPITFDSIPKPFIHALLDTEDKRFYSHSGIDFISLINDSVALLLGVENPSGASTITMQLARNVSFSLERTFIRKFKEMLLALKIEQELTKEEILELYINVVPFGKRAYGAEAAALTYYGKPLRELNLPQLAMIAGIPQAPSAGNPVNGPERALRRRNTVLARMAAQDSITPEQYEAAVAAPMTARLYQRELDVPAPYPAEWVRQQLRPQFDDLYTAGYEVITTLDSAMQTAATAAVRKGLHSYDRRHGYRGPEAQIELPEDAAGESPDYQASKLTETYLGALSAAPTISDLRPAVVTGMNDITQRTELLFADGSTGTLDWESSRWARRYFDADTRGPRPDKPSDIFAVGDLIRVQRLPPDAEPPATEDADAAAAATGDADGAQQREDLWRLSQIPDIQGALVAVDPDTGAVRAMRGGFDFAANQYNHALQAARQPGSGFKPFVYSSALHHGVTPASMFLDAPLVFDDQNLETEYRPDNDNNQYNGPTRLREALYRSINLVSMRVLLEVQAGNVLEYVTRFGFDTRAFPRNTQLAIGGGTMAVTPLQMATAYATLANGGYAIEPHVLSEVRDINGDVLFAANYPQVCRDCDVADAASQAAAEAAEPPPDDLPTEDEPATLEALLATLPETAAAESVGPGDDIANVPIEPIYADRVVDERNAYIMTSMLGDVIRRGTGRRARSLGRADLAGKTGTTNDAADTWFNGYNQDLAATVWVGFGNHAPLGRREYGSNTPLPIWIDFMETALAGVPERSAVQPPGIVTMRIDPTTGDAAPPEAADAVFEYFLQEHAPEPPDAIALEQPNGGTTIKPVDLF